jgi:hypothetical protein
MDELAKLLPRQTIQSVSVEPSNRTLGFRLGVVMRTTGRSWTGLAPSCFLDSALFGFSSESWTQERAMNQGRSEKNTPPRSWHGSSMDGAGEGRHGGGVRFNISVGLNAAISSGALLLSNLKL